MKVAVGVAVSETIQLRTISGALQQLGTLPAGAGKLAKTRAIIPVYSRFTMVRVKIPFLDVSTSYGKTTFWSGLETTPEIEAFAHAKELAGASGRTTLEMTKGGAWLGRQSQQLDKLVDWQTQMRPQWGRLSTRFAKQARGAVEVYKGPRYAGANSVWEQFERTPLERLKTAGKVTDIHIIEIPAKAK